MSWKHTLLIHSLLLWTSLTEYWNSFRFALSNFYYYLQDYYYGNHDIWLFVPGHSLPISLSNFYNINNVSWMYHNRSTTLEHSSNLSNETDYFKMSWLSANIRIHQEDHPIEEYNIDDFLSTFVVKTTPEIVPSLTTIFQAWCSYKKHWFHPLSTIEFCIIDEMGEDRTIELIEHNYHLVIHRHTIQLKN